MSNPLWDAVSGCVMDDHLWGRSVCSGACEYDAPFKALPAPSVACGRTRRSRDDLVAKYAWGILSPGDLDWIVKILDGQGVVEIGAGRGYWASQLASRGVDVLAYDPKPPDQVENSYCWPRFEGWPRSEGSLVSTYHPVLAGGPDMAVKARAGRALLLCWPSYDEDWAWKAAQRVPHGGLLIYCGEGSGGCNANDAFFGLLDSSFVLLDESPHHIGFFGIHDRLEVWRRK